MLTISTVGIHPSHNHQHQHQDKHQHQHQGPDVDHLGGWHPPLPDQNSLALAQRELVQDVVDRLHLPSQDVVQPERETKCAKQQKK